MSAEIWTLKGFLDHFRQVHKNMNDHSFCWILGAGASKDSGIPTGAELVELWLQELKDRDPNADPDAPLATWATDVNTRIKRFDYAAAATFYPRVFERRFCDHPEEGHAYLETLMARTEPSPGYSILAKILETQRHNVVITTNFDNLVADALAIYTDTFPFVCGHESLASFIRPAMRRPVVCKIHRDLLLNPHNTIRRLKRLHESWAQAIHSLFNHFTPTFIGYGGNDDSLMDLLESLDPGEIKGQLIWCYYGDKNHLPSQRIQDVVEQHLGVLVPAPDFDSLMVLLGAELEIEPLDVVIEARAAERKTKYIDRIRDLNARTEPRVQKALEKTMERIDGWWAVEYRADAEPDLDKRALIYLDGLTRFPDSGDLYNNFAVLLQEKGNPDLAEQLYAAARRIDPGDATIACNLADLLAERNNFEGAEPLYREAARLAPNNPEILGKLAVLLSTLHRAEADEYFRRAIDLDSDDVSLRQSYADFLQKTGHEKEANEVRSQAMETASDEPTKT